MIDPARRMHRNALALRASGFGFRAALLVVALPARVAALALALGGCAGSPVPSYYVLGAAMPRVALQPAGASAADTPTPAATDTGADRVVIVLDDVRLPEWLDRPQMALQAGAGRLRVDADHRWGEPLAAGVERLVAAQLRTARPGAWVAPARSGGTLAPPNWRIAVTIDSVQARPGGSLSAWVRWQRVPVGEPQGRQPVIDQAVFDAPLTDAGPEALADAWTRLAIALGQRLATGW